MMDGKFTVIAVNGEVVDLAEPLTDSLRFDNLSWSESVELCRLSFMQGYQCVIWMMEDGDDEQTESAVPEKDI